MPGLFWFRARVILLTDRPTRPIQRLPVRGPVPPFPHPEPPLLLDNTVDNGHEFARPTELEKKLDVPIYFAHPYHAWERGTNENTNGLLRQYLPKDTDLSQVTNAQLQSHVRQLNHRPRKCLGFQTPSEVFHPRPPG